MANNTEVKIILSAVNNATDVFGKTRGDLEKLEKAARIGGDVLDGMGISLAGLSNPANLAGQAIAKAGEFIKNSTNETLEYNKSIRLLSQNLALSTEETSRIVQTMDDFGVEQDAVTSALQMALKNGFAPTVDTLAQMADKYKSIQDPTKRAAELTKVFGKNWTQLVPALQAGGTAIREAAAAQDKSLIVTEASSKATRDYEIALDEMNDKVMGVQYSIGNALIPAMTKLLTAWNDGTGADKKLDEALKGSIVTQKEYHEWIGRINGHMMTWADVGKTVDERMQKVLDTTDASDRANRSYATSTQDAADANTNLATSVQTANEAMTSYTSSMLFNKAAQNLDADAALALAERMGLVDQRTSYANTRLAELTAEFDKNRDGVVSANEGLSAYIAAIAGLDAAVRNLPSDAYVNIHVFTQGSVPNIPGSPGTSGNQGTKGGAAQPKATGGDTYANRAYLVGERGPELFVPKQNGTIIPNNQLTNQSAAMAGAVNKFTMNVYTNAPTSTVLRDFAIMRSMA